MATTYHDWDGQTTDQGKYDRLVLYLAELRVKNSGNSSVSGGGMSVQFDSAGIARLEAKRDELEQRLRRFGSGRSPLGVADMSGRPR